MGTGEELGRQLRGWVVDDHWVPAHGQQLANRLIDLLGAQDFLRAPLRDLAVQPLFLQLLRQLPRPSRATAEALRAQLSQTYSPGVLAELDDLIETATELALRRSATVPATAATGPAGGPSPPTPALGVRPPETVQGSDRPASTGIAAVPAAPLLGRRQAVRQLRRLALALRPLAPAVALSFSVSLVLAWVAHELDRAVLAAWGWSAGASVALLLLLLQLAGSGPLQRLRRRALLDLSSASDPQLSWRWLSAPWLHGRGKEAVLNALMLLVLLGSSSLPLDQLVLRFCLTSLATLLLAVLAARERGLSSRRWGGASGAIAAIVSLAASLSLLDWRVHRFTLGLPGTQLSVPAWVLLVVYAALQLRWQLARSAADPGSSTADRLWSSTWWWGSWLGVLWALLTWAQQQLDPLLRQIGTA